MAESLKQKRSRGKFWTIYPFGDDKRYNFYCVNRFLGRHYASDDKIFFDIGFYSP